MSNTDFDDENDPRLTGPGFDLRQKVRQMRSDAARFAAIDPRAVDVRQKERQMFADAERFVLVGPDSPAP